MIQNKHKKWAAIVAICCGAGVGAYHGLPIYEGEATVAYRDASPQRIWTYCFGETERPDGSPVRPGDTATPAQCRAILAQRVERDFITGVESCVKREMPVKVEAAFVSLAYNIGVTTFCRSSIVRKWNEGYEVEACDAMLLYNRSGGIVLKGLTTRRQGERDLCMEGLS